MKLSKERAIQDLELGSMSEEQQDYTVGKFFEGLEARVKIELFGQLTEEQLKKFDELNEAEQDDFMEEVMGDKIDDFIEATYKAHVKDFHKSVASIMGDSSK